MSTSALGKCFKSTPFRQQACRAAAVFFVAALFLVAPFPALASPAVKIMGVPEWLVPAVEKSLSAVIENIPKNEAVSVKQRLLFVVSSRLFEGYEVRSVLLSSQGAEIHLKALQTTAWTVQLNAPNLSEPPSSWFASDSAGMSERIQELLDEVPLGALFWGDSFLREALQNDFSKRLPGWDFSLLVQKIGDKAQLQVSFTPKHPVTLAVDPELTSRNLPTFLYAALREEMLKDFSPIIGLPLPWVERHQDELIGWSREVMERYELVQQAKVEPKISVQTAPLSRVAVNLDSRRFAIDLWLAAYLGNSERYPEVGIHLGRNVQLFPHHEFEIYTELIATVDDWDLESRFGLRFFPWGDVQFGGEWSSAQDLLWFRLALGSRVRHPYGWLRISEERDLNAAVGWRFTGNFSAEIYYDSRNENYWSIRAISNL